MNDKQKINQKPRGKRRGIKPGLRNRKIISHRRIFIIYYLLSFIAVLAAGCSFDYGNSETPENTQPDIVMEDVEYVRVRGGKLQVRFQAEKAERYEDKQKMNLKNFSFEQFGSGKDVNAEGHAGAASVELDSGNIFMDEGVRIGVESEDLVIETKELSWKDKERMLLGGAEEDVAVSRSDGTTFSGRGFSASARERKWSFSGFVEGSYFHEDDDEESPGGGAAAEEAGGRAGGTAGGGTRTKARLQPGPAGEKEEEFPEWAGK